MKRLSARLMIFMTVLCIALALSVPSNAYENGKVDAFPDGEECISCHVPDQDLGLGAGYSSISIGGSEPAIFLKTQVDMTNIQFKSDRYGVLLLTHGYGNLSEDGWTILGDPNGTTAKSNYVERPNNDNSVIQWRLKNFPGNYTVKVVVMFGSGDNAFRKDMDVNIPISKPPTNFPPSLTNPRVFLLADGKTYDFEVTYTDLEFDIPRNISVNISGLGSFEMQPKSPGPSNVTKGVTYYYLTALPEGRYSYYFSASDGNSWNSTANTVLRSMEDEEKLDSIPLVLGIFGGLITVVAVRFLRKR